MIPLIHRRHRSSAAPALRDAAALDRLFDDVWRAFGAPRPSAVGAGRARGAGFVPRADVHEEEGRYLVSVELPGLAEDDFEVAIDDGVLVVQGEKRGAGRDARSGHRHLESASGRFERRFALPDGVDVDAVTARYARGVLLVSVPKPEEGAPGARTVPVTQG